MSVRVLLADDELLVRAGLRMILEAEPDIEVVGEASDGAEALAGIARVTPDAVVMDVMMPRLDGLGLAARLRERGAPPILLLSAVATPMDAAIPFLAKPFDVWDLLRAVGERLRGGEPGIRRGVSDEACARPTSSATEAASGVSVEARSRQTAQEMRAPS